MDDKSERLGPKLSDKISYPIPRVTSALARVARAKVAVHIPTRILDVPSCNAETIFL